MTKLKKILATILALSLLAGFSVSVASFAVEDPFNIVEIVNVEKVESFKMDVCDRCRYVDEFFVRAKINGNIIDELLRVYSSDETDEYYIYSIDSLIPYSPDLLVPETLFGKKVNFINRLVLVIGCYTSHLFNKNITLHLPNELKDDYESLKECGAVFTCGNLGVEDIIY